MNCIGTHARLLAVTFHSDLHTMQTKPRQMIVDDGLYLVIVTQVLDSPLKHNVEMI